MVIFMSNGLRTLLTLVLVLIAVILFNLYNFNILPWYICIIIMIFSILIYCKIVDIKKFMIDIGTRYREKEELTEYQKEQMHNEMMNNMLNEMDEDEKNEKVKFLRLFFVLIVISLIVFLILLVMGKAQIELVEAWISIVAIILGIIIMPREKQKSELKGFISILLDIVAYTVIILGILLILKFILNVFNVI